MLIEVKESLLEVQRVPLRLLYVIGSEVKREC